MTQTPTEQKLKSLGELDPIIHSPSRLMVMTYLYVVEGADFTFLKKMTGLTWGNLSTHLSKLENAGYVEVVKGYKGKKPHTLIQLTNEGRAAFQGYKEAMKVALSDLPD
jgi:DNA-binding MarR family transcriptional regulator